MARTALTALALCMVGCAQPPPPPYQVAAQSYLSALAEGNYDNACALLDGRTLARLTRSRVTCAGFYHRCLPNDALKLKLDQSQLLYATLQVSRRGSRAEATASGTAVAEAISHVTLADEDGHWKLTSFGSGLTGCRLGQVRHRHEHGRAAHSGG